MARPMVRYVGEVRRRLPSLIAAFMATYGVICLWSAASPGLRPRMKILHDIVPWAATTSAAALTAGGGALLVMLAWGLHRRKHLAWRIATAVCGLLIITNVVKGLDLEEALIGVVFLLVLLNTRGEFQARSDPSSRVLALGSILLILLVGFLAGLVMVSTYADRAVVPPGPGAKTLTVLSGLIGLTGPIRYHPPGIGLHIAIVLSTITAVAAAVGGYLLLRSTEPTPHVSDDELADLRRLLDAYGGNDSLGYFALRTDKDVIFSPTRKAAITYRVLAGVALASGDPIGDPEAWPGAIAPFLTLCREYAWTPAVIGCSELGATVYTRHGLRALELGDEAVVDVAEFTLDGREMRNVRQCVTRIRRAGYTVRVRRRRDIAEPELADLAAAANSWRADRTERGFSMALGRFGSARDPDCVVVTAHKTDQDGTERVYGLLDFVPWGPDGLSLDLMRRDRIEESGLNEFLIVELLAACAGLGVHKVSLNFAMFRSALERGARLGASPVARAWRGLLVFASRWWQIESLYRFNAKFRPRWVPRYVCFASMGAAPRVGLAAMEAEAFWRRPAALRLLAGRAAPRHTAVAPSGALASRATPSVHRQP